MAKLRPLGDKIILKRLEAESKDRLTAGEILDLLELLNREFEKTIVMVTHDPLAARRATRTLHLDKGRLVHDVMQEDRIPAAS